MEAPKLSKGQIVAERSIKDILKHDYNSIIKTYGTNIVTIRIGDKNIAVVCKTDKGLILSVRIITSDIGNIVKNNGYGRRISKESYIAHKIESSNMNKSYEVYLEV